MKYCQYKNKSCESISRTENFPCVNRNKFRQNISVFLCIGKIESANYSFFWFNSISIKSLFPDKKIIKWKLDWFSSYYWAYLHIWVGSVYFPCLYYILRLYVISLKKNLSNSLLQKHDILAISKQDFEKNETYCVHRKRFW